ncbi:hypothetical protein Dvina_48765 [Dactylosporangium vinaceum]|uniref:CU044_5270 family protein n=1 Tax=Dactylosporangium vinaceum TaxID=53362 RepID=A0ABV5LY55_9ACTN|nr:hypothetical protein [Dactylosporangium vinaceum]UAB95794.1 hypothetical protein Dvina_48765 [Dactylosporangium vinaceum]
MSSTDDRDLHALREFRSALDNPPEGVLVRGRYRLASSEYRPPSRRRQWVLAGAGAAAALAVVVGVAVAVNGSGPAKDGGQAPAERPSAAQSAGGVKAQDLPVTPGTRAPLDAQVSSDGGATHAKAVAAMDRLAAAGAGAQPMQVGAGQVLYVKTYNLTGGAEKYIHEVWMDPQTIVALRIRRTDTQSMDTTSTQQDIDAAVAEPASLYRPTSQYLASLPTDPDQLIAALRQWSQARYPDRPADGMIWKDAFELLNYSEPFWTPQQRTAIYRALAKMPDLKGTTAKIDNRPYDLLCLDRDAAAGSLDCLLFDSATGRYAGSAWPAKNLVLTTVNVNLVDYGTQPRPAPDTRPSSPVLKDGSPKAQK